MKSTLKQSMIPFQDMLLEISDILKSLPNWNPTHLLSELPSIPNSFVTPSQSTSFTYGVDAIMPGLEQDSCKEYKDCLVKLEEET